MHIQALLWLTTAVLAANAIRIIQANDDGWAELYARSFHDELLSAGHDAVLSCPADNKSGTGKSATWHGRSRSLIADRMHVDPELISARRLD